LRTTDELSCRANIHIFLSPLLDFHLALLVPPRKWAQISVCVCVCDEPSTSFGPSPTSVMRGIACLSFKKANKKEIYSKWLGFYSRKKKRKQHFY
jgi:hypothetical protein